MEQNKNKFSVVVGDFGEDIPPLFYGSFTNLREARKKLDWLRRKRKDFDEENAYIYETIEILNLENDILIKNSWINWIRENKFKIFIIFLVCLGIFWFGIRPQIVRTNCAEKYFDSSLSIMSEYNLRQYSTCLKLHGLTN